VWNDTPERASATFPHRDELGRDQLFGWWQFVHNELSRPRCASESPVGPAAPTT
jgi:hypothetical protein